MASKFQLEFLCLCFIQKRSKVSLILWHSKSTFLLKCCQTLFSDWKIRNSNWNSYVCVSYKNHLESILDPVAQQVHKSIQKLHCRVVNVIIFSSSYHVSFVSCFLSIFLNIDLANLMCMGSYMTDYIKISTNLHDGRTFFSNNENR